MCYFQNTAGKSNIYHSLRENTAGKSNIYYSLRVCAAEIQVEKSNRLFLQQTLTKQVSRIQRGWRQSPCREGAWKQRESAKLNSGHVYACRQVQITKGTKISRELPKAHLARVKNSSSGDEGRKIKVKERLGWVEGQSSKEEIQGRHSKRRQ